MDVNKGAYTQGLCYEWQKLSSFSGVGQMCRPGTYKNEHVLYTVFFCKGVKKETCNGMIYVSTPCLDVHAYTCLPFFLIIF